MVWDSMDDGITGARIGLIVCLSNPSRLAGSCWKTRTTPFASQLDQIYPLCRDRRLTGEEYRVTTGIQLGQRFETFGVMFAWIPVSSLTRAKRNARKREHGIGNGRQTCASATDDLYGGAAGGPCLSSIMVSKVDFL